MKNKPKPKDVKPQPKTANKPSPTPEPALLSWSVIPFRQEKRKALIFVVSCLAFIALLYVLYQEWLWVAVAVVVLTYAYSQYIFPAHYRLTARGVTVSQLLQNKSRLWADYKAVRKHPDGVFLVYGTSKASRLGHFIYFGDQNPETVISICKKHIV